ncbi:MULTISPECIES: prepilin-type N-terminal cleavage/methylation domain-containing protein [Bacillaceae]|uniref:Prepilin-type N-terminal cleavage/methylation domain-containing protein n=1 Tax=Evansella alkalicola TaxID=745819 RepID=A0ABS6K030_9BACI|nr:MULTISPECIES: prepilin-type N-terminal cleavage/methylation domain-containing protein [Bacillaceae]MBU9724193.1 prepilin-type N-terminal cleavage/methylation domain-containing protein [Bacillus alkalicola]
MFRSSDGFSFIEVIIALFIFSVVAGTLLPAIITVQQERFSVRQERYAEELINQIVYDFQKEKGVEIVNYQNTTYIIHRYVAGDNRKYCVNWEGKNGREYERCLLGKRE